MAPAETGAEATVDQSAGDAPLDSSGPQADQGQHLPPGAHIWSFAWGSAQHGELATGVAIDSGGNVLVGGGFGGGVSFGGPPLANPGAWLAKLSPAGAHIWSRDFAGSQEGLSQHLAVDAADNVVGGFWFRGSITFGTNIHTSAGAWDGALALLSASGTPTWSRAFGGASADGPHGVAVDPQTGRVIVAGGFAGATSFGGNSLTAAGNDIFIAAYAGAGGAHQWSTSFGSTGNDSAGGVAIDGAGNVLLVANFAGSVAFGNVLLTASGASDIAIVKLSPTGVPQWAHRLGGSGAVRAMGIETDSAGNLFVVGSFTGDADFGQGSVSSVPSVNGPSQDGFLVKLHGADGNPLWFRTFGGTGLDFTFGAAVDSQDDVVVVGGFRETVNFGAGTRTSAGDEDIYVAKYAGAQGSYRWGRTFGGPLEDRGIGVAADGRGVVITGFIRGTVDFGGQPLTSAGDMDAFVAKLAP